MKRFMCAVAFLCVSCASGSAATVAQPLIDDAVMIGKAALASKTGIQPVYVDLAMSAAKTALGSGVAGAEQKAKAAEQGVAKAAAQALIDGKSFTDIQKTGLTAGLKELL